ncbi:unnamed protein product (macronuclear) [Paramecium tetraurelia]|uniref:Lysozyme n=1 Tax=Paramecium tetraurelia TaxID=5888 RepID=A0CVN4_PARTE|nr:uncharacterized protein GSPATT00011019001 [Paramecium tetraurelia]CAK74851.1 unnamed protein product [Paramecium tetraurelia]|eukprot:XP_001442248.1 hypothetical protein (macronuclear) [Paramecium tetraurelia strain d4-2]
MKMTSLLIVALQIYSSLAVLGFDLSAKHDDFQCFVKNGYQFAITRAYRSFGAVDLDGYQNLEKAKAAGLLGDVYFFPCKGKKTAKAQVQEFAQVFGNQQSQVYGTVWVDVESNPSTDCGWTTDYASNCNFLQEIVNELKGSSRSVGIYASQYQWTSIFGSASACSHFASLPLWYPHYDQTPTFDDFPKYKFGGWTTPSIKQYSGSSTVCGVGVDLNYYK